MIVAVFFYLACGLLARMRRGIADWSLGLAYLAKAIMFPISLLCLPAAVLISAGSRRGAVRSFVAFLVFISMSPLFIVALSIKLGTLTFKPESDV